MYVKQKKHKEFHVQDSKTHTPPQNNVRFYCTRSPNAYIYMYIVDMY